MLLPYLLERYILTNTYRDADSEEHHHPPRRGGHCIHGLRGSSHVPNDGKLM